MSNSDRLAGPDFLDSVADQSAAQGLPVNAAEFRQRATDWRADQARIEQLEADLARLERQLRSDTERARILDKLKTHLQAADEALAWPPPPTPPTRLAAETSNARGEWVLERLRGVLEHGKMGDKCLIAPDLVTAAIAALSAQQPPAEAQPVAKLVNRKDADGGKTTTFIRPTSLGMDLPLGEYPLHLHPSAPTGDDRWKALIGQWQRRVEAAGYGGVEDALDAAVAAKSAAPAEGEEIMVNTPYDVFTLPLRPSGLDGKGPRFVVHVPGPEQQPAAVDGACAAAAIRFALSNPEGMEFLRLWNEGEFDALRRQWPEAPSEVYVGADPLATQHQEPKS